jgi:hypothetical protein
MHFVSNKKLEAGNEFTMTLHAVLGTTVVVITLISFVPYLRDVARHRTKPHVFSWLGWTALTTVAFLAQVTEGAGPGSWTTGVSALLMSIVFLTALRRGETEITKTDWLSLVGSGTAAALWAVTSDPTGSVILLVTIYACTFVPTFRKSYLRPHEETLSLYIISSLKMVPAIAAIEHIRLTTVLYPAAVFVANGAFVLMTIKRRRAQRAT